MRKDSFNAPLPDAGGLSGVKRMQMQERGTPQMKRQSPALPKRTTQPVGYEAGTRLQALASPNFPRRRGQGLR